jgi:outer membrane protein
MPRASNAHAVARLASLFSCISTSSIGRAATDSAQDTATPPPAPGPRAVTLSEAIAYARQHQPAARAALARADAARADARVPGAQWQPLLIAGAELVGASTNNTTATPLAIAGIAVARVGTTRATGSGSWRGDPTTFAALSVEQELFDFGRIAAETAVTDALADVERLGADAVWLRVALDVEESYFAVLASRSVLQASEEAFQRARVHRDYANAQVNAGLRPPIDLTRAEADLTRFDVGRIRARGGLDAARIALAAAMGAPDPAIDATDEPAPVAPAPPLAQAFQRAQQRDPTLSQAAARLDAQQATTHALQARLRPNLALSAAIDGRAGGAAPSGGDGAPHDGWLPEVPNWDVGVVLRWPLYDAVLAAQRDASRAREDVRRAELDEVRQGQRAGIQRAYVAVNVAGAALRGLDRSFEAARANYEQADARYRGGLATVVELADAESLRTDAEIQRAIGRFDVARARAVLGRLIAEEP